MRSIYRSSLASSLAGAFILLFVLGPSVSNFIQALHTKAKQSKDGEPFLTESQASLG